MENHLLIWVLQILSALSFVIIGDSYNYLGIDKGYYKSNEINSAAKT